MDTTDALKRTEPGDVPAISFADSGLGEAAKRLGAAKIEHETALDAIACVEERMRNTQAEAEEMFLASIEANTEFASVIETLGAYIAEEDEHRALHQVALDILADAQRTVERTKEALDNAEQTRFGYQRENAPVFIKEATMKIAYNRHMAMAELESSESRVALAAAERKLVQSKIEIAEVQLDLLASPDVLESWQQIQEVITFNAGGGLSHV